jgi:hypothetical protein
MIRQATGKTIGMGKATMLITQAKVDMLRRVEDRSADPPYVLGPDSRNIAPSRRGLLGEQEGRRLKLSLWDVDADWVGRKLVSGEASQWLFLHKKLCQLPTSGPSAELGELFSKVHSQKPIAVYDDPKIFGRAVPRLVKLRRRTRLTVPEGDMLQHTPFVITEEIAGSIPANDIHNIKSIFYGLEEPIHLAKLPSLWIFKTTWAIWVVEL